MNSNRWKQRLQNSMKAQQSPFHVDLVVKAKVSSPSLLAYIERYMPVIRKSIAAMISFLNVLNSLTGSRKILVGTLAIW